MTFRGLIVYQNRFSSDDPPRRRIDLAPLWESGDLFDLEDLPANLDPDRLWVAPPQLSCHKRDLSLVHRKFLSTFTEFDGAFQITGALGIAAVAIELREYAQNKAMEDWLHRNRREIQQGIIPRSSPKMPVTASIFFHDRQIGERKS